jgi:hypothetical protein
LVVAEIESALGALFLSKHWRRFESGQIRTKLGRKKFIRTTTMKTPRTTPVVGITSTLLPTLRDSDAKSVRFTRSNNPHVRRCAENTANRRWHYFCKATAQSPNPVNKPATYFGAMTLAGCAMLSVLMFALLTTAQAKDPRTALKEAAAKFGTYYSMQRPGHPPLPYNPFPDLPVSWLSNNTFAVDDRKVDYEVYEAALTLSAEYEAESESFSPLAAYASYGSNVLWIEILTVTNNFAYLTLHGTKSNYWYQLLSKPTLDPGQWTLGQTLFNADGTNQLSFDPVPTQGLPHTFYRAVEGRWQLGIYGGVNAVEANSAQGLPRVDGSFGISSVFTVPNDLAAVYRVSGSASNGADCTTLNGTTTIPAAGYVTLMTVEPIEDNLVEFEEYLTLSLVLTNGYVIDPGAAKATIMISDNFGTNQIFSIVTTGLTEVVEIDYHPPTQSLLVSQHFFPVADWSFLRINSNGVVTNWTGITNLDEEKKLAVVQQTAGGFTAGEIFFGTGVDGVIGKTSADGSVTNLNWLTLTNEINATLFRGSFYVDQTGIFSNNLIAVTGGGSDQGGEVWRITSSGNATLIVALTNQLSPHLEGVITLTNDVAKWGPWAGKILSGAESKIPPQIHSIDTNGIVESFALGIAPEDFDVIPTNQDLYIAAYNEGQILRMSKSLLTNFVGDLLITQEGSSTISPKLFIVHWDAVGSNYLTRSISAPSFGNQGFEHSTFAPISLPTIPQP